MAISTDLSKHSSDFGNAVMSWWRGRRSASINFCAGRASIGMEWRSNTRTGATTRTPSPSLCEACTARFLLHGMFNAYWEPLTFDLPPVPTDCQQEWRRCMDTALDLPDDIFSWETAPVVTQAMYVAQPRSVVLLVLALE